MAQDAWSIGAAAYFTKPFNCDELVNAVRRVLAAPRRIPVRRLSGPAALESLRRPALSDAVAEDEAAMKPSRPTVMNVPKKVVPAVRELIA